MKRFILVITALAFLMMLLSQTRTMIVYKNGVKQYETIVSNDDSIGFAVSDTVRDVEGNVYRTIRIGSKLWMIDNLRTTLLNDGTPIEQVTSGDIKFANGVSGVLRTTPAYSWHNNLSYHKPVYGALYNWYSVESNKLAPSGWRVATKEDWNELEQYLAGNGHNFDASKTNNDVSKIAKSLAADRYWISSTVSGAIGNNLKANNSSGLSILPGGYRDGQTWATMGSQAAFWTLSHHDNTNAVSRMFAVNDAGVVQTRNDAKQLAFSVRCVKDIVAEPTAGMLSDAVLNNVQKFYESRRNDAFEALRSKALVVAPLDYEYQTTTGAPLSRAFSYSLTDFAFKSLWLNANVDQANAALVQNADFYLNNPNFLKDRDSFYWSSDEWLRLIEFYGSKGTKASGRITAATEAKLYDLMYLYLQIWSPAAVTSTNPMRFSEHAVSNTWDIDGSENHHVNQFYTYWHFSKLLKDHSNYADRLFPDGTKALQVFNATTQYVKRWIVERAKKGLFVEAANDDYNAETLKGFFNIYDFAPDSELRNLSRKLIDLYWATWAQEQIKGMRGGAKTRVYRGNASNGYTGDADRIFGYKMAFYYMGLTTTWPLSKSMFTAVTSDYRMPLVIMDLAMSKTEMGDFEIFDRSPGLAKDGLWSPPLYRLRQDYGGIVRYSYCTPDFIMGSLHIEARPQTEWTMISSQNRWQGVIFDGDPFCRIYPQAQKEYRAYNQHWSVQSKGCMVVQALTETNFSKYTDTMRVYFSPQGLTGRIERNGWVFVQSAGAYAAVKSVSGTHYWDSPGGRWMTCTDKNSPVIIQVGQKADFSGFTDFQNKILALPLSFEGQVLKHTSIYGDEITFYANKSALPRVNNIPIDLRPTHVFKSPFIKSVFNSGVVEITKNKRKLMLDFLNN
jgi:uncharacterized protein (TIGR02145 family)